MITPDQAMEDKDRAAAPYGDIARDPREAVDEAYLKTDLAKLTAAVTARASRGPWALSPLPASWLGHFGPRCRTLGENCLGDGQDASYFFLTPQPIDDGQVYAVLGTLGTQTGNATYNGLSVNDASLLKGVANHDKLFVHFLARDCAALEGLTDGACTTITDTMVPPMTDVSAPGDPHLHGFFTAGLRSYVKQGSARGPITVYGPDETGKVTYQSGQLPPVVLAFTSGADDDPIR